MMWKPPFLLEGMSSQVGEERELVEAVVGSGFSGQVDQVHVRDYSMIVAVWKS